MYLATSVDVPSARPLRVDMAHVGALVDRKVATCPFYRRMMEAATAKRQGRLTLIVFSDEAQTGNVLQARHSRKANLAFFAFMEFPLLHLEELWLPLAAMLAHTAAGATYAAVTRAVLEATHTDVVDGFPFMYLAGGPTLAFIDACILLGDQRLRL